MERYLISIALGAISLLFLPLLPSIVILFSMVLICFLLAFKWPLLRLGAVFLLAMSWSVYQAHHYLNQRVPTDIEGKQFRVLAKVDGLAEYTPFGQKLHITPLAIRSSLSIPVNNSSWLLTTDKYYPFRPNQQWQLTVTLKRPHGTSSAGAFDYEQWLMSEGITATGKISRAIFVQQGGYSFDEWRLQLREQFQENFGNNNVAAGVTLALLTGDRALVPSSAWDLYAATGTSHLMAISGTHVMLAAMMAAWLLTKILKRFPHIFLNIPLWRLRLPLVLAVALAYGCLAGLSLPTLRTLVMVTLSLALTWFQREISIVAVLLRAFVLMVLWQPLSVHAIGFWLSFMAVAVLLLWAGWQRQEHKIFAFGRLQLWLTLALVPLTLCFFGRLSLISPLANFIAIPVITFAVVPLDLFGLLLGKMSSGAQLMVWQWAVCLMDWLNGLLAYFVKLSFAQLFWVLSPITLVFLALSMLVLLLPKGVVPRYLALMLLLPVFFRIQAMAEGELRASIIDVGQGLSVLLQTQHHSLLYDTGANTMAGERIITPYLRWSGVSSLDTLMISHNDNDHTGGADALLAQIPIKQAFYSAAPEGYTLASSTPQHLCQAGQHWQWDQVDFVVLSPIAGQHYDKDNNRSCVLRVSGRGFSVLLTGDMEVPAEKLLLASSDASQLASQILVLGHHGSKTSTSPEFLAAVKPHIAIVSAGYRNQFGHPAPSVVERLMAEKITIDNTIIQGTLMYQLSPTITLQKEVWRERGHYWLNSP